MQSYKLLAPVAHRTGPQTPKQNLPAAIQRISALLLLTIAIAIPGTAGAGEDALPLSAQEVQRRWHTRLEGRHFQARVRMEMNLGGLRETRRMRVFRDDKGGTGERVLIRFETPPDLRNVSLLYLENEDHPNDYFLYTPETRRVRRLPESVIDNDIYGIDPEFLGFGVARSEPTKIRSMTIERIEGRKASRLAESALNPNPRFEERVTWIDAETFIPLRTEHILNGRTVLVAQTREIVLVQGIATPRHVSFEMPVKGRQVELYVEEVDYQGEIPEDVFSTLSLMKGRLENR